MALRVSVGEGSTLQQLVSRKFDSRNNAGRTESGLLYFSKEILTLYHLKTFWSPSIRKKPGNHVGRFWRQRYEIPKSVMGGRC